MISKRRLLWIPILAVLAIRTAGGGDLGRRASPLAEVVAQHRLVLVYRAGEPDLSRAIAPVLSDLAAVYAPDGLGVAVAGLTAAEIGRLGGAAWWRLSDAEHGDGEPSLALYRPGGEALAVMSAAAMDLYVVYRACERYLRGRDRVTFFEHVTEVLAGQLQRRAVAVPVAAFAAADAEDVGADRGGSVALADLLADYPDGCLVLPPGCTDCLLEKHAAALADLFAARPATPVLVFAPVVDGDLRRHGWSGTAYQLPQDAEVRLLALRQAGHYAPVLVATAGDRVVSVRPLRGEDRS